jgi:hypothetical protein
MLPLQVELATMYQDGELTRLWDVARQTDLTFNLVRVLQSIRLYQRRLLAAVTL